MFLFNIFLSTYLFCLYIAVCVVWIVVYFIQQLFLTHSVNKQSFKYVTIILIVLSFFNFNILSLKHSTLPITFVYSLKLISLLELFLLSSVVSALKKQSENIFKWWKDTIRPPISHQTIILNSMICLWKRRIYVRDLVKLISRPHNLLIRFILCRVLFIMTRLWICQIKIASLLELFI